MSELLPPNATKLERALAAATQRFASIHPMHRDVWDPDLCPAHLLPWLAWAHSLDDWNTQWPENVKRARIRTAIEVHRKKGTIGSLRRVVQSFGGALAIREWFEQTVSTGPAPRGIPHTFDMTLTVSDAGDGYTNTAAYVDDIIDAVLRTKPVRSHFVFTQGLSAAGGIGLLAAGRAAVWRRIELTSNQ
ncbi:MAG: phage tail protein I [Lysobacteraceae bacterium]